MGRAPCCDKANVKRGPWSPEEDAKLKSYIHEHGTGGNWIALPHKIGLKRCGKSCRLRWLNYLRPDIKHGGFSDEEDNIICSLYLSIGSRWSIIAAQLPGRTDNDIKNYWNTRLKKKLMGKQRKEQKTRRTTTTTATHTTIKQEMKREKEEETFMAIHDHQSLSQISVPYWPELHIPTIPQVNNSIFHEDKSQESIRKLLATLGGKFSDHDHQQPNISSNIEYPFGSSSSIQGQLYDNLESINNLVTCPQLPNVSSSQGFVSYTTDLVEMGYNEIPNYQLDGSLMENFSGVEMGTSKGTSSVESTSPWGDMNSLVYPPPATIVAANYESCQEGRNKFDDLRYFGSQFIAQ